MGGFRLGLGFIAFFFFVHGSFYYLFPEQHYLSGSLGWLVYLKYILAFLFCLCFLMVGKFSIVNLFALLFFWVAVFLSFSVSRGIDDSVIYFSLLFPALVLLLPYSTIRSKSPFFYPLVFLCCFSVIVIGFLMVMYELAFSPLVSNFAVSSFRATGIFVNPNNSGITAVLMLVVVLGRDVAPISKFAAVFVVGMTLVFLGSKTAYILYMFVIFVYFPKVSFLFLFPSLFVLVFVFRDMVFSFLRDPFDFQSLLMRFSDWADVYEKFQIASVNEILFGFPGFVFVDNGFLDLVSNFGVLVSIIYLFVFFSAVYLSFSRNKVIFVLLTVFFMAMWTTNLHRLWPSAYVFWGLIGWCFSFVKFDNITSRKKGDMYVSE